MEREALWRMIVEVKYDHMWGWWCSNAVSGSFNVGVSKNVRRGWGNFSRFTKFEAGDGSKIKFWHNVWCGDQTVKVVFPELFSISRFKEA
jgi:hypothetical protein